MCSTTEAGKRSAANLFEKVKQSRRIENRSDPQRLDLLVRTEDKWIVSPSDSKKNLLREPVSTLERFEHFKANRVTASKNQTDFSEYFKSLGDRVAD